MNSRLAGAILLTLTLALPAFAQGERLILAHRMIGFGPHFQRNAQEGPYGFIFPIKDPAGADTTGWCREGHLGALHPAFPSRLEEFKWEISQAQAAGVDGFILDTCQYVPESEIPDTMLEAAAALGGKFKVGLCLDYGWGGNELKVASVAEWLKRHRDNPSLLRLHGLPAFVTYGSGYRTPEEVATMFKALREAAGEPIYLMTDLTEFPNKKPEEWEPLARAYAGAADALTCFYSRQGLPRNAECFAAISRVCHELGKDFAMSLWGNYYAAGRTVGVENIGADNSRLWDGMWQVARDTKADLVQLVTWNDITEDTTIMPGLRRHFTFCDLLASYYAPYYKTGKQPKPTRDEVFVFYRPYRTDAKRPLLPGPLAPPSATQNFVEVRSLLTAPGTIMVDGLGKQNVAAGMSSVEFESKPGPVRVLLKRGLTTVVSFTAPEQITDRPWREDYAIRGFSSNEAANWAKWFPGRKPGWIGEYRDDDHNGLPNWFEHYYFGQWTGTDAKADPDGDGKSNLQEYLAGTDPRNPPVVYPAGFRWDNVADFKPDNATYPVLDKLGAGVWEYDFITIDAKQPVFQTAGLLVKQIPAWLERGNSWEFGLGRPLEGTLSYFGEGNSASSQVWTSPVTGSVQMVLKLSAEAKSVPVQVTLAAEQSQQELWSGRLAAGDEPVTVTRDLTVKRGDRLRLTARSANDQGKWSLRAGWTIICPQALKAE